MSYEHPRFSRTYSWIFAHADGDASRSTKGPKGMRGRLIDYGYHMVTTTFAGGTTTPQACVGTSGDQDAYGEEFLGGLLAATDGAKSILSTYSKPADIATYILNDGALPADTAVYLKNIVATGSSAGGAGTIFALVHWGA